MCPLHPMFFSGSPALHARLSFLVRVSGPSVRRHTCGVACEGLRAMGPWQALTGRIKLHLHHGYFPVSKHSLHLPLLHEALFASQQTFAQLAFPSAKHSLSSPLFRSRCPDA